MSSWGSRLSYGPTNLTSSVPGTSCGKKNPYPTGRRFSFLLPVGYTFRIVVAGVWLIDSTVEVGVWE